MKSIYICYFLLEGEKELYINNIELNQFRNYKKEKIEFSKGMNIIYGENGQGKTNILEAISICSIGKSFRNASNINLKNNESEYYGIEIDFFSQERNQKIEVKYYENKREIILNGIKIKKIGELIGNIPTVIFTPDSLKLIKDGPSERRRFLDIMISQIDKSYFYKLQKYNKIIINRNHILKEIRNREIEKLEIEIWNKGLIETGAEIIKKRIKHIEEMKEDIKRIYSEIAMKKEEIEIEYSYKAEKIEEKLEEEIKKNRESEIKSGITITGPQRHDIIIKLNNMEMKKYGSQGQQRTAVMAIKLAELNKIKKETDEEPVLLLDDIMSELDKKRRRNLNKLINDIQVIVTTTEKEEEGKNAIEVRNGKVNYK
jgi:DNA replication and repair protein RecF